MARSTSIILATISQLSSDKEEIEELAPNSMISGMPSGQISELKLLDVRERPKDGKNTTIREEQRRQRLPVPTR